MTISFTSQVPLANATQIAKDTSINFTIESDGAISLPLLAIRVNGSLVVEGGVAVVGSGYSVNLTVAAAQIDAIIIFSDSEAEYESYSLVEVEVIANDGDSFNETYSFRIADLIAPVLADFAPLPASIDNDPNTPIFFRLTDDGYGIRQNSIIVSIYSALSMSAEIAINLGVIQPGYSGTITQVGTATDVFIRRDAAYASNDILTVDLMATDESLNLNEEIIFNILDITPPNIQGLIPADGATNISEDSTIAVTFADISGVGVDTDSIQISINGQLAVEDGIKTDLLSNLLTIPSGDSVAFILTPTEDLPSAKRTYVYAEGADLRRNEISKSYSFLVRDSKPPQVQNALPADGYSSIIPSTDIRFSLVEESDGYGVNFEGLHIEVDGYSIINQRYLGNLVDGYIWDYSTRTFETGVWEIETPTVYDAYGITYPGYSTIIENHHPGHYDFIINPTYDFDFLSNVTVKVDASDRGGNASITNYSFTTADAYEVVTTATPNTDTYRKYIDGYGMQGSSFLHEEGVVLETNFENTITFFTLDGTVPQIDKNNRVLGRTQVFTKPILLNKAGLNVIKFFSIDQAGNKEVLKQEVYMLDIIPPEIKKVQSVALVADVPFPTTIIPLENVELFESGEIVRVLDDKRPPLLTKILATNETSDPAFIIIEDQIDKLKINRNARVEKLTPRIDPQVAINFDPNKTGGDFYIGCNGFEEEQSDAVFEQFRILNKASSDAEILADFTLLDKGVKFFNQEDTLILSSDFSDLEKERANLNDATLVLIDFDGNVDNVKRQGVLKSNDTAIVDTLAAANDVIFTIKVKKTEKIDRELLREILINFAPTDLNVIVRFEDIS